MKERVEILEIPFINTSFSDMVEILADQVDREEKTFIVTANPEIVMHTYEDRKYKEKVLTADFIVPDGNGILLAAKILDKPIAERIAGFDLMMKLLELANLHKWSIYLLGGREGVNQKAAERIKAAFPDLVLAGRHNGYFNWEDGKLSNDIEQLKPDIVFVALGFPRQEHWISENISRFSKGLFIGVGGSIDVIAGEVKRAPEVWQKMKLEWFYRLLQQPARWKRMLALPKFVIHVLQSKK
ncbi:WecB/TagA/CpsF family glycosyltransferase [Bacillus sp. 7894-2]|uniref:WecB/TagA/CpsF family glycosyltransferase n=1 Tax=Bacillus sp. 7894-2 TaxID=2021695 RepID=UPI000BA7352C|nr:WecB/TagA/CpsF family glycosyltransferase [Bacillus sp. 7894-2]PAE25822.1 glycosyltransferase [Bacillus sp. 7894-2]